MVKSKLSIKMLLLSIAFISACSVAQPQEEEVDLSCQAGDYRHLIGKFYEDVKSKLPAHRWKRPEYMYTNDYVPERLNIKTDESGMIVGVKCG